MNWHSPPSQLRILPPCGMQLCHFRDHIKRVTHLDCCWAVIENRVCGWQPIGPQRRGCVTEILQQESSFYGARLEIVAFGYDF